MNLSYSPHHIDGGNHREDGAIMGVRSEQRDALLGIFSKMAHAATEAVFYGKCTLLAEIEVLAASAYFEKNWLPIKKDWVSCYKGRCFNLGEFDEQSTGKL